MAVHRENSTSSGAPHEREQHGTKRGGKRHVAGGDTVQLIFTLQAATGAVTSIEKVDPDGKRHEIKLDETVALAGKGNLNEIEAALDEAFEAGISSVLEPAAGQDEPQDETEEDAELRRALLARIISQNVRRRLQRRLAQRLALSQTLAH
jgi:hypothetical protein